ncbi:hypothetical protein ES288_A11G244100v1 [Gossypium darwinii]|uniref:Uncharacterized protein n=2 Tax=Gossypium TaxID=3633 RepID=A0A5D2NIE2_GOSTO|nr:hypothetical protein ES288_A11G244100v1 [Gossypium darwinii]TYI02020.1 hypothetical protein ES332_A11G241800v1 [Gossypium tomentosum]
MRCATLLTSLQDINQVAAPEDTPRLQQQRLMHDSFLCLLKAASKLIFSLIPIGATQPPTQRCSTGHSWNKCSLDSTPFWHLLQEADPLSRRYCRLLKVGRKLRETRQAVIFILEGRSKFHSFL